MIFPFVPQVGGILSADIAVSDHDRELNFYSRVLTTGDIPLWREDLLNSQGTPVIGLGKKSPEYENIPMVWMPHIQVADVAASAQQVVDLGGEVLLHGKDAEGNSQWAAFVDPHGAAFGVIPVVAAEEAVPYTNVTSQGGGVESGLICGLELLVPDVKAAQHFYSKVVGWTTRSVDSSGGGEGANESLMRLSDGSGAATIRLVQDDESELASKWLLHLPVGNLADSLARVQEEGGKVISNNEGTDQNPATAVIQDPVGVYISLSNVSKIQ